MSVHRARIGVDLGGTKVECAAIDAQGETLWRERVATPKGQYEGTIEAIADIVERCARELGEPRDGAAPALPVGLGMPGSVSPATGLQRNSNSVVLNGRPFVADLAARLARPLRASNDANCFALAEATLGAGRGARVVFGVILGTGVGGGVVVDGRVLDGHNGIGGEWGHNPMPPPRSARVDGAVVAREPRRCYCGLYGCREQFLSGPSIEAGHLARRGESLTLAAIAERARTGDRGCAETVETLVDDLAASLAEVVNVLDPDCIVFGGGVSNVEALYALLPERVASLAFTDAFRTPIRRAERGDSSGVFGAAMLWPA